VKEKFLMVHPIGLKVKMITTEYGSKYFLKWLQDGYVCVAKINGYEVSITDIDEKTII